MYCDIIFLVFICKSDEELVVEEEKFGGKVKKIENWGIDLIVNCEEGMVLVECIKDLFFVVIFVVKKDGKEYVFCLFDLIFF